MSDVHLEFGQLPVNNDAGAEVLLLAGDICVAAGFLRERSGNEYHTFFRQCSEQFRDVVYIMGNHEHYNGDICTSYQILKTELDKYPNIHFLERELESSKG